MYLIHKLAKEVKIMGMTDKQFNAYVRKLKVQLDRAIKEQNWELVKELTAELQKDLED